MAGIILLDDNPSELDFLGFDAVVIPVMQAIQAPELDPVTIGIHAPWGGGKSTVLGLIAQELASVFHAVERLRAARSAEVPVL